MRIFLLTVILACATASAQKPTDWLTDYEKSGYAATPTYAEAMEYLKRIDKASPWVRLRSFGISPQGRELPLVIVSKRRAFDPLKARKTGLPVILVESCIHAGEPDGKDATLMLLREIAITKSMAALADHVTLLFMPIFNADGHERRSPYNRINQNGPVEQGWRTTAQNLNLNRDFLKADAPEMRAWLRVYNEWMPELLVDCHVTNGIDFRYNLTYSMEMFENCPAPVVEWQGKLRDAFTAGMKSEGDPVFPYVFPRENLDISKGIINYASPPRLSTGYAAVRNRAALLIETHMLKPYRERVTATYRLLVEVLRFINGDPGALLSAVARGDDETAQLLGTPRDTAHFPLIFTRTEKSRPIEFDGYEATVVESEISGGKYTVWNHDKPVRATIPFFDDVTAQRRVRVPAAYIVPAEWTAVSDVLSIHDVHFLRLVSDTRIPVEVTKFSQVKFRETPYEGRQMVTFRDTTVIDTILFPAGSIVVAPGQRSGRAAVHLLEARGPDSFVAWGFFNAIFEAKEYFEPYMMEGIAKKMLDSDSGLKLLYEKRLATDSAFSKNPRARLGFFHERSPWADPKMNVYPVGKYFGDTKLLRTGRSPGSYDDPRILEKRQVNDVTFRRHE